MSPNATVAPLGPCTEGGRPASGRGGVQLESVSICFRFSPKGYPVQNHLWHCAEQKQSVPLDDWIA